MAALMAMPAVFDEHETTARAQKMGQAIKARMQQLQWNQVELAERLGVAQGRVSEFINGQRTRAGKGPQSQPVGWEVEWVRRLEQVLEMRPGSLFYAAGYVPMDDVRSLVLSARTIEQLIKNSLDIEEAAKPGLMANVRASRREALGD